MAWARYILLKAGHIGQNVYLVCEALGIKLYRCGGVWIGGGEVKSKI